MQVFGKLNENKGLSIALGYFDGVHLGHQAVIKSAVDFAIKNNSKSAVITFKDHPCCYFYGVCPKYILSREDRQKRIADLGVDYLYELDFDEKLCALDAEQYLNQILFKYFEPKSISTGFNHYFGAKKSGNVEFLKMNQLKYGYKYFEISPQYYDGEIISSTLIRRLLSSGKIDLANKMLIKPFEISGKVVEGQKMGRNLGYRTANVEYPMELVDIPFGVYEVDTQYGKGLANFGIRPTISNIPKPVLETHILDFNKNIYGETIQIKFHKMLRIEHKFNSIEELKNQICVDISAIKKR